MRANSLDAKIEKAVNRIKSTAIMRKDLEKLGGYDQIGRSLRKLVRNRKLLRLGYGVYAKTKISPLSGNIIPAATIDEIGKEVLKKLKKKFSQPLEDAYNKGKSDQVPTGRLFFVEGRMNRKLKYQGKRIYFETSK